MGYEREKKTAVDAVTEAAEVCARMGKEAWFREPVRKADGTPVTVADLFVQTLVNEKLADATPEIPIAAEESSVSLEGELADRLGRLLPGKSPREAAAIINMGNYGGGGSGRFWTLDPIDGTRGFLAGRQYSIALALVDDGDVVLAALGCPELRNGPGGKTGFVFFAEKGKGAFQSALGGGATARVSVSGARKASQLVLCESASAPDSSYEFSQKVARSLGMSAQPVRMDGQGKYALLARGDVSVYLRPPPRGDYRENIWDHAAGGLIAEEAGGTVTDSAGRPLDFSAGRKLLRNGGIVATNGPFHEAVVRAVGKAASQRRTET